MTKKHFVALADALRDEKPGKNYDPSLTRSCYRELQWTQDLKAVAAVCQRFNPAFNLSRWMGYINGENGPSGGKVK